MMFLDASAIIGIIAMEDDAESLVGRLARARSVHTSAIAVLEAATGLARIANCPLADGLAQVDRFLAETGAEIMAIDHGIGRDAIEAFGRYGKGRHPVVLNLAD